MVGVENEAEAVLIAERGVATAVGDDQRRGLAVEQDGGNVEVAVVEGDPNFRALGGRLAFEGFRLLKARGHVDLLPEGLAENIPVDHRLLL